MRRLSGVVLAAFLSYALGATAAPPDSQALIKKRDEKLASAFLKKAPWITDYDKARAESKKSGKPIFAYFTRSYAY